MCHFVELKSLHGSSMPYLRLVSVNEKVIERLWDRISEAGSYYSIGDGVTKEVFSKVLFQSNFVLEAKNLAVRLELHDDYVELHPIVFGPSAFREAKKALEEISTLFSTKPICCIIPSDMRGARRLAQAAGMRVMGMAMRPLSGVPVRCTVFEWRKEYVNT